MKKLNIKTSKGEFLVVDGDFDLLYPHKKPILLAINGEYTEVRRIIKLSDITEEQASEIVDSIDENVSCRTSLHSLIKSKSYHLFENPFGGLMEAYNNLEYDNWKEAEEKTLYNPYIFKIC